MNASLNRAAGWGILTPDVQGNTAANLKPQKKFDPLKHFGFECLKLQQPAFRGCFSLRAYEWYVTSVKNTLNEFDNY
jgi:hypothetical protein